MDERVFIEDDTPVISLRYKNLTENVTVKFVDGVIGIGYFNYANYLWYSEESKKYKDGDVVAWKSLT